MSTSFRRDVRREMCRGLNIDRMWQIVDIWAAQKSTSSGWAPLYVFLAGFAAACAVISLYFAVTREGSNILVIAPIVSCNPLVTLVMARLFLRQVETITKELVIGTLMAVGGVGMVVVGGLIG